MNSVILRISSLQNENDEYLLTHRPFEMQMSLILHRNSLGEIYRLAFITCSPMESMGAVRMRAQTADKNITITHK